MLAYQPIISAYASFFELSVALNFAYAASSQFRETMKSGFLYNIRKMDSWYSSKQKDVMGKLTLMSDEDVDLTARENIKDRFTNILKDLRKIGKMLKNITIVLF